MKIYLAHNFDARIHLRAVIQVLEAAGHEVNTTWITDDTLILENDARKSAEVDLRDIDRADALILFLDQYADRPGKGKYVEFGYALARGKQVYTYGNNTACVFTALPQVRRWDGDLEAANPATIGY